MNKNLLTTLIFGFIYSFCFAQTPNRASLDSFFQSLDTNNRFTGSIAISKNDTIIYTKNIGKADVSANKNATDETKYRIGSISKMFTSSLIFKAIEEKKIILNQTIDKYFPGIFNAKKITIGNLLNHRSGIHNFTNDSIYSTYFTKPKSESELTSIILNNKSDFEPGSKAEYSNSNYVLLSFILERIYKKTYSTLLMEKIVIPLQLKNTHVGNKINTVENEAHSYSYTDKWNVEPETDMSIPMGAGAIISTPTDLIKFITKLFQGKIISFASLEQMKTLQDNYGMGMFQVPFYKKIGYGHTGGIDAFQSVLYYFQIDKVAIAITGNGQSYSNNDIVIAGLSWCFNMPFTIPDFKNSTFKPEDLSLYLGEYASADIPLKIIITAKNTILYAQATGQSTFALNATEKDKFEFKQAGIVVEFNTNKKQMILKQGGGRYTFTKK